MYIYDYRFHHWLMNWLSRLSSHPIFPNYPHWTIFFKYPMYLTVCILDMILVEKPKVEYHSQVGIASTSSFGNQIYFNLLTVSEFLKGHGLSMAQKEQNSALARIFISSEKQSWKLMSSSSRKNSPSSYGHLNRQ